VCVRRVRAEAEFGSAPSQNQPSGLLQAVWLSQFGNGWLGELGLENEIALMYNGLYLKASFRGSG
jgi:hypothetical protein